LIKYNSDLLICLFGILVLLIFGYSKEFKKYVNFQYELIEFSNSCLTQCNCIW